MDGTKQNGKGIDGKGRNEIGLEGPVLEGAELYGKRPDSMGRNRTGLNEIMPDEAG